MRDENDKLIRMFREKLHDYKHPVDPEVWAGIERELSARSGKVRRLTYWKYAGIAASVLLTLGLGVYLFSPGKTDKNLLLTQQIQETVPQTSKNVLNPNTVAEPVSTPVRNRKPGSNLPKKERVKTGMISSHLYGQEENNLPKDEPVQTHFSDHFMLDSLKERKFALAVKSSAAKRSNIKVQTPEIKVNTLLDNNPDISFGSESLEYLPAQDHSNRMAIALSVGNMGALPTRMEEKGNFLRQNSDSRFNFVAASPNFHTDYEYRLPISFGFSIRKYLNDRWSVESGLNYTYLSSTETVKSDYALVSENNLACHYLGIPIKLAFTFYNSNRMNFYISGGGMVEKMVYGTKTIKTGDTEILDKLSVSGLQYSVSGGLGLNYLIVKKMGLFVEPGVGYYFDDKSEVMTIRKDKPFNFNIQAGLRLTY